jgi:hypothetical protein
MPICGRIEDSKQVRSALPVVALLLCAAPCVAQEKARAAAQRPGWLPNGETRIARVTPAQRAKAVAVLEDIERILLRVPELAQPQGFRMSRDIYGGARRLGPGQTERPDYVFEYMLRFHFYAPGGIAGHGSSQCITVRVNQDADHGSRAIYDEQGRGIYTEAQRGENIPFTTQVYGELSPTERSIVDVLLASGDGPPWKHVTREQYYHAVMLDIEGKNGEKVAKTRQALATTPYQEWIARADERKKNHEAGVKTMLAIGQSPAEIEKFRKAFQDTERQVTEALRKSESTDRTMQQGALGLTYSITGKMRAELDSMGPAGRNMPAFVDNRVREGPMATGYTIVEQDGPGVWRVLTPNYDFWRARKSPVEVRTINVHLNASLGCMRPPIHRAVWATYNKLDWAALNRLLDVPRQ